MQKIGFLGMGVMGLPMAKNVVQKCGLPVLGYDVVQQQMDAFREAGGIPVSDPAEIYKACDPPIPSSATAWSRPSSTASPAM